MNDTNKNQYFVYEFDTSFVEMSYSQFFEGYCILFQKNPILLYLICQWNLEKNF